MMKTGLILFSLFIVLASLIGACTPSVNEVTSQEPEDLVRNYFEAWDSGDFESMYASMSDGFKSIEPTANTLESFASYAKSQGITGVEVIAIDPLSNSKDKAAVNYEVSFITARGNVPFEGTFSLRHRAKDKVPGWKLIHPYGDNVDTS
jgi:ABC-type oligopeptide transport system substrate-binding subunit